MPKQKALKASPLVQEAEATVVLQVEIPLTLEERTALRAALTSAYFKKALHNARLSAPSVFTGGLNGPLGATIANNRLHEIRGWQAFEAAIGRQVADPKLKPKVAEENYPDAGRV